MAETEVRTNGNGTAESDDENVSRPVDIEQVGEKLEEISGAGALVPQFSDQIIVKKCIFKVFFFISVS